MVLSYSDNWQDCGTGVREWLVDGVRIPFNTVPPPFQFHNRQFTSAEHKFISAEILELLQSDSIVTCKNKPYGVSPISCVPKKGNTFRLVHDLRFLNQFSIPKKFQYEDIGNVVEQIKPQDSLVTLDIKSGFHHIPVHLAHQDYLGFEWQGKFYKWKVTPFGLNCSPYYFCKTLKHAIQKARESGLRVSVFVDDIILMSDKTQVEDHTAILIKLLKDLGWKINWEKSSLQPGEVKHYIGYQVHSNVNGLPCIKIPADRVHKLKKDIRRLLKNGQATARILARVAGQCVSMTKAILPGKLLLRNLYRLLAKRQSWEQILALDQYTIQDLQWWLTGLNDWNYRIIRPRPVQAQLVTDASGTGWGAVLGEKTAAGYWNKCLQYCSSNHRELLAILMGLRSFETFIMGKSLHILSDNISAVAYLNHLGGPSKDLTDIASAIWEFAMTRDIDLRASHLAGRLNQDADQLSRLPCHYEWQLHRGIFNILEEKWGPHSIDHFATLANTQLPLYNSRYYDPGSSGVDALSQQDWGQHNNYVNAPFRLIPGILQLLKQQQADATLISPVWPGQMWHQELVKLSIAPPLELPNSPRIMSDRRAEPLRNLKWKLCAWRISGKRVSPRRVGQTVP